MSDQELGPCPLCRDRCFVPEFNGAIGYAVQCTNCDPGCDYSIEGNTHLEAIELHNRLTKTCRWSPYPGLYNHWIRHCDEQRVLGHETWCGGCGGQIEEVMG